MPTKIRYGEKTLERENTDDVEALFQNKRFRDMITRQLKIAREHCHQYPLMDKDRTITIKLKIKPIVDKDMMQNGVIEYDKAVFTASVGSPTLPETSVEFNCAVSNGVPYYNLEDPKNPLQLTFRDYGDDTADEPVKGKAAAVKS